MFITKASIIFEPEDDEFDHDFYSMGLNDYSKHI